MCVDFDNNDQRAVDGNLLPKDAAEQGLIFYEVYRDRIMSVARKRRCKIKGTALYANLLKSKHIPLNIFTSMEMNLEKAKELFIEIIGEIIASI